MSLKAISICSGIGGVLSLYGVKVPDIPDSLPETMSSYLESAVGNLAACDNVVAPGSSSKMDKARKVYGAMLEKFKQLLLTADSERTFCGLGCVEHRGYSCWTLEENRGKIATEGREEIENDVRHHNLDKFY